MKTPAIYTITILFISGCILSSCDNSIGPESTYDFPAPIDSVATDITLYVYSAYNDSLLTTIDLPTESNITIAVNDTGQVIELGFNIYARAVGFFTKLFFRNNNDTLTIDLDAVPQVANSITGVIFSTFPFNPHRYYSNGRIDVTSRNGFFYIIHTDNQGRFGLGDLPEGVFTFTISHIEYVVTFDVENTSGTDYEDLSYEEFAVDRAPYIYLYPETETDIEIELDFLNDGYLTQSEPPYNGGWDVHVTPDGVIDGQYDHLFYEAVIGNIPHSGSGWVLSGDNLEINISNLLTNLGFIDREIDDFIAYWVPLIEGYPYYAFFYLEADSIVGLTVDPVPGNIIRALFIIQPLDHEIQLQEPDLPGQFSRDGFTLVEWGVIGWTGQ